MREVLRRTQVGEVALSLTERDHQVTLEIRSDGVDADTGKHVADDELLLRFADAAGMELVIERQEGLRYRAMAMNSVRGAASRG